MQPHPFDLFGEIPVTEDDVHAWVAAVAPRWLHPERSYRGYVKGWNVIGKIKAAKLSGHFYLITDTPHTPYHARLSLDAIL